MAGQAHAAHHIDVEKPVPVVVGDFGEGLGFEYAEIVDQDVGARDAVGEMGDAGGGCQVGGNALDAGALDLRGQPRHGFAHAIRQR